MQFSFNFLPEDTVVIETVEGTENTTATVMTGDSTLNLGESHEERAIRVIECPTIDLAKEHSSSSMIELRTPEGGIFSMQRVQEDNPENEYDLIPGKYEGGSKIWECSLDLAQYVMLQPLGGSVLELGCGHGLPAIAAMVKGCSPAVLLDFNDYVLSESTWPSIALNCPKSLNDPPSPLVCCLGGDWRHFTSSISSGRLSVPMHYDLILSAETLYSVESCQMVYRLLLSHLAPGGVALIASKKYYFGVGGGTWELQTLVTQGAEMQSSVVFTAADGKSNVREIIEVRKRSESCGN